MRALGYHLAAFLRTSAIRPLIQPAQLPQSPASLVCWRLEQLSARALALAEAARLHPHPLVALCPDSHSAELLKQALETVYPGEVLLYPHWENLPYDNFSPHSSIISDRMLALLAAQRPGSRIIITTIPTLLLRLGPKSHFYQRCFQLETGQMLGFGALRQHVIDAGYLKVSQVSEQGEFALRGSLIDFFPMASNQPIRVDFFDDSISSLRTFDPETQQSTQNLDHIQLIPTSEVPDDEVAIASFTSNWNQRFPGTTRECAIYQDVRKGMRPAGIEYYLPLFCPSTASFFDYLSEQALVVFDSTCHSAALAYWDEIRTRYDNLCGDLHRPILPPQEVFFSADEIFARIKHFCRIRVEDTPGRHQHTWGSTPLPELGIEHSANAPLRRLVDFAAGCATPIVLACNGPGRLAVIAELLDDHAQVHTSIEQLSDCPEQPGLYLLPRPLPDSCTLDGQPVLLSENTIYGELAPQVSREQVSNHASLIRHLVELSPDCLVVHEVYGIGRYRGLEMVEEGDTAMEFMAVEYADQSKLLVPVTDLHHISRYQGATEEVQLDCLGSDAWKKKLDKAAKRARDSAVELLEIYARRALQQAAACTLPHKDFHRFCAEFPFVETPDQRQAIAAVIDDMCSDKTMDRLVCGDVGFGKTEVAMRAAFVAVANGRQVALLCPTTLLAQQHYNNFVDRFATWPIKVGVISRFLTAKQTSQICQQLELGEIDILIGTHALLTHMQYFTKLGLVIIDEEHRFGVHQKEQLKTLRSNLDVLTLTATPIPRTLNFSLSGLRDLSIIATAPSNRLAIQTLVLPERDHTLREAVLRELMRGGQIFVVYNQVRTINHYAERLAKLIPEARIGVAHGQMHERELERVMTRFYHQQFNLLVCSTIIENGIDIPSANTIVVIRADKFGLAQLHQLRGRVGRSHHQAYAYLFVPEHMTDEARQRLNAIAATKTLGAGFTLAMQDLEIRGAGELLGHEQSGDIARVGFTLYLSMLERAIKSLKSGKLDPPADQPNCEIDVHCSALIPADYVPDVQTRLQLYKRMANTSSTAELTSVKSELIDRFGRLPQELENLLQLTRLRHRVSKLGIVRIRATAAQINIGFAAKPAIDLPKLMQLVQSQPQCYRLRGDSLVIHQRTTSPGERVKRIGDLCAELRLPKPQAV